MKQFRLESPRFRDIPQFIPDGNYSINVSWSYLERQLGGWIEEGLDLDPDFQRAHVWGTEKQIAYVEFILRGGRSSRFIFFNNPNWQVQAVAREDFVLVDGKQRLQAVRSFLRSDIPAFGVYHSQFVDKLPAMCGPDFIFQVNTLRTRAEVLEWYLQLNAGGVVHTKAELDKVRRLLEKELDKKKG